MNPKRGTAFWDRLPPGRHTQRIGSRGPAFNVTVLRGRPGRAAVINAGTHGDEYEGPTVIQSWIDSLDPARIRGTLVLIPVLHEAAFFAGTRSHPIDGSNLARVFPGKPKGNHAERLADQFLRRVLRFADYYLDLHSGGVAYDLLPWCGYMITGQRELDAVQHEMAACFDEYWCWGSPYLAGRTLSSAATEGVAAIYTESRGGGGVHPEDVTALDRGIRNFLRRFGFLSGGLPRLKQQRVRLARRSDEAHLQLHHPAPGAGLFLPAVAIGATIRKKALLGRVVALDQKSSWPVLAEHGGTVVCLRRKRSVERGDALATLVSI